MTRLYLPASLQALARLHSGAGLSRTGAVEAEDDAEESEYAALLTAAVASAELVGHGKRRVVVVAEVDDGVERVVVADVVAVHVDVEPGAEPDDDLAWFATQEIDRLLEGS
ncbi:hypothetical protein I601_2194 [Nocardioides dokdonensis FR1436]|uniref:Uncharacterized protein n=1 Tax=Nocardioides dokdonensis FR1436 TaxID=1300347 RepID=A0A1A9GK02_9ACTN|nr:hypothetical protein [Nocardioides dokdonensis]ANH38619.1 hypothetical protein I601_2194 [Nocardioides dokdonensis FR1436]